MKWMSWDLTNGNIGSGDGLVVPDAFLHYSDVARSAMTSQITGVSIACSTAGSGAHQRKHQSSASLVFVRGIHRWPVISPYQGPVKRKIFSFTTSSWDIQQSAYKCFNAAIISVALYFVCGIGLTHRCDACVCCVNSLDHHWYKKVPVICSSQTTTCIIITCWLRKNKLVKYESKWLFRLRKHIYIYALPPLR